MTKKGREFNEIYDLTAMRVVVDSVKDCYGAVGVIHSLWKPLPGRFKDFVAMPKFNMYQSLHTTVIGPEGLPLEIQIRTREMHDMAEFGVAAHWIYKDRQAGKRPAARGRGEDEVAAVDARLAAGDARPAGVHGEPQGRPVRRGGLRLHPKGEVKSLAAGATPLDFAYEVHTEIGHRCVGAQVNGKIVPLHYQLKSGDIVEVLTSKRERGPSRDWLAVVKTTRARNKIKQWFKAESREDTEHAGRELLQEQLKKAGLPAQKIVRLAAAGRRHPRDGLPKADDFYIALGGAKISAKVVVNKVMQRLKQGEAAEGETTTARGAGLDPPRSAASRPRRNAVRHPRRGRRRRHAAPGQVLPPGARATRSWATSRWAAASRSTATTARTPPPCARTPTASCSVHWEGDHETAFKVELQVDAWDRHRLLEDLSRTFAEAGINIVEARCIVSPPMVQNRFVVEVGDTQALKADDRPPAQHRRRLRRLPRHARRWPERRSTSGVAPAAAESRVASRQARGAGAAVTSTARGSDAR